MTSIDYNNTVSNGDNSSEIRWNIDNAADAPPYVNIVVDNNEIDISSVTTSSMTRPAHINIIDSNILKTSDVIKTSNTQDKPPLESSCTRTDLYRIMINDTEWNKRIQDNGCRVEELLMKRYKQAKILSVGPQNTFYYYLTAIVVDYVKSMQHQKTQGHGWSKLPKNVSNVKLKILNIILSSREEINNIYILSQHQVVDILNSVWGTGSASPGIHENDRNRVFGLIMSVEDKRPLYERLVEGVTDRSSGLHDPSSSIPSIFQKIAFDFNNEVIIVELPPNYEDVKRVDTLNPNDFGRINIQRDCELS